MSETLLYIIILVLIGLFSLGLLSLCKRIEALEEWRRSGANKREREDQ